MSGLTWHGAEAIDLVKQAMRRGIDKTSSQAVAKAKSLVHIDTATLQGSIMPIPARIIGNEVIGQFGSFDVKYAEPQEFLPAAKGGKPYLRPAAEEASQNVDQNIEDAWLRLQP